MLQPYLHRIVLFLLIALIAKPLPALSSDLENDPSGTQSNRYDHLAPAFDHLLNLTQKKQSGTFRCKPNRAPVRFH
jgi:hypothetical protein